jgi:DNA-binding transcriptional LysR family regulator
MRRLSPSDHRLAAHDELRIADLAGERFISYRQGARLRELLESAARDAGFEPRGASPLSRARPGAGLIFPPALGRRSSQWASSCDV